MVEFKVISGKLIVSDPCYGNIELIGAANGTWEAEIKTGHFEDWGKRVTEIEAKHPDLDSDEWESLGHRDVDSGQMWIGDMAYWNGGETEWYDDICKTHGKVYASLYAAKEGVLTTSGFGDGGYELFGIKDEDDNLVAVKVVFITEEEIEQWQEDEDDEDEEESV